MRRLLSLLVLLLTLFGGAVLADQIENQYLKVRNEYQQFLTDLRAQHTRSIWEKHIRGFLQFTQKYPSHPRAADALFIAGDAYTRLARWSTQKNDLQEAVKVYERMQRVYPDSSLADNALFKAAKLQEERLDQPADAYAKYKTIVDGYPNGDQTKAAQAGMIRLAKFAPPPTPVAPSSPAVPTTPKSYMATPLPPAAADQPVVRQPSVAEVTKPPSPPALSNVVEIRKVDVVSVTGNLRIIVYLTRDVSLTHQAVQPAPNSSDPGRLLITFVGARPAADLQLPVFPAETVQNAQLQTGEAGATLNLSLKSFTGYRVNFFTDPPRAVIDIQSANHQSQTRINPETPALVVLDPGHGGDDHGAGHNHLVEKDIALQVAQTVRRRLQSRPNLEVLLTREEDRYLPLDARCALANDARADLFVSIHLNGSPKSTSRGIEIYTYATQGNSEDLETVRLENQSAKANGDHPAPSLADFSRNQARDESRYLARSINRRLLEQARQLQPRTLNRGVKSAPVFLLRDAKMPAVLVEIGFTTNRQESVWLARRNYLVALSDGIAAGIVDYLQNK